LLSEEERLEQEAQSLVRERAAFKRQCRAKARELDRDARELESQRLQLETERQELQRAHAEQQRQWKAHLSGERQRLAGEEARLRSERASFESERRRAREEIEAARKQLAAEAEQFRTEQQGWREHREREAAQNRDWEQNLDHKQRALWRSEQHWQEQRLYEDGAHRARLAELEGLEHRLRNTRRKVMALQEEASKLEGPLTQPAQPAIAVAGLTPHWTDHLWLPGFEGDAPAFLALVAQDLVDLSAQLAEQSHHMAHVRASWHADANDVLAELERRSAELDRQEADLLPAKQTLAEQADAVARQAQELARRDRFLRTDEARLGHERRQFEESRGRLLAQVKARAAATRERHALTVEMQRRWESERKLEVERLSRARAETEAARRDHVRVHDLFRNRLLDLTSLQRQLLQREIAIAQLEQRLVVQHQDPMLVETLLAKKHAIWQSLIERPTREFSRRRRELNERARQLEGLRIDLIKQLDRQEKDRANLGRLRTLLDAQQVQLATERTRWVSQVQSLQEDRRLLAEYVRELKMQLEAALKELAGDWAPPSLEMAA
jgi:hypothetical protein